jgi:plastocyanin domain-containing protein
MNKNISIILALIIIISAGYFVFGNSSSNTNSESPVVQNIEIKNGVQYVTITAKNGYTPRISTVKADMPTKLIVKTNNTYDCSAALVVNSLKYRKMLPPNGETEIDLGTLKVGDVLRGVCAMGMYSFEVRAN